MVNILKYAGVALAIFLVLDTIWLGLIAKNFYKSQIGTLMKDNKNWIAIIGFYIIFIFGLSFFVIEPAILEGNLPYVILAGMFFGFVAYSTYDLVNLATFKDFPATIALVDMVWGSFIAGASATATYFIFI